MNISINTFSATGGYLADPGQGGRRKQGIQPTWRKHWLSFGHAATDPWVAL